ncbi:GntR family transcriptional regulator [Nocardioides acrostichi]|nr:GntR family transcriptional regulator [Nocardioides acrostichi]
MQFDEERSGAARLTEPLNRLPLRDQAVGVLRDMVVTGALRGGERINEAELAARLGISRGPLREAIQRLGAEGFVEFRLNRGAFVRTMSPEQIRHLYEVRELIEVRAAELAAARASETGIGRLREMLQVTDELLSQGSDAAYPPELDLHELVLEMADNSELRRIGSDLQNQVKLARMTAGRAPDRARQALAEHREILSAITARDSRRANRAMRKHLRASFAQLFPLGAAETDLGARPSDAAR